MANTIRINVQDPEPLKLGFDDSLTLKYVGADHTKLDNLDYENSGHTGFMPSKLSILPETDKNISNNRLILSIYDDETQSASKINFTDLAGRIIKASGTIPTNTQKGQFLFLEIMED